MFEIYFTRWDNCKMRGAEAEAGCTRITCALDDENEEKIFIHCKRKTNWGETCRNPALDIINILFCVFFQRFVNICIAYLSPVLQPLAFPFIVSSDIGGPSCCARSLTSQGGFGLTLALILDRNPLSLHFQSWILQNHSFDIMKISKTVGLNNVYLEWQGTPIPVK